MAAIKCMPNEHHEPTIYFTAMWLQAFNKELILERLDLVEEFILDSYHRFKDSEFDDVLKPEIECINDFLESEIAREFCYKFTDD